MSGATSSKPTESMRAPGVKSYEGITLNAALERLWQLQHEYQELVDGKRRNWVMKRFTSFVYVNPWVSNVVGRLIRLHS